MQRVKIDLYIADLLYSYDCVIVPNFGGFVGNYASAKLQDTQHKFTPPSKKISFNKHLKVNDGLLTNHIAGRKSVSYDEANEIIRAFVNHSIEGLNKGDKIKIEKVGTLFLDAEQNIQFEAEAKNDFLLDSFGLTSFRALPIERATKEEVFKEQIREKVPVIKEKAKKKKRYYIPAAAMLLLVCTAAFWLNQQFDFIDKNDLQYGKFDFLTSKTATYKSKTIEVPSYDEENTLNALSFPEGIVPYITSNGEKTKLFVDNSAIETIAKRDNTKLVNGVQGNLKFHVMGGCFSQLSNAKGLVKTLNRLGFSASLIGSYNNLHAVSMGSFATREEATALLGEVRNNEHPDAWLLVKQY